MTVIKIYLYRTFLPLGLEGLRANRSSTSRAGTKKQQLAAVTPGGGGRTRRCVYTSERSEETGKCLSSKVS